MTNLLKPNLGSLKTLLKGLKPKGDKPVIFALFGKAGAGKDTFFEFSKDLGDFKNLSFFDGLYKEVSEAFDVSIEFLKDRDNKEEPTKLLNFNNCMDEHFVSAMKRIDCKYANEKEVSPRVVLQLWGTEYRRAQDENYWTKQFIASVKNYPDHNIVVTSVRYENELKAIESIDSHRSIKVRIVRPDLISVSPHSSEKVMDAFKHDHYLLNDDNLFNFKVRVEELVRNILGSRLVKKRKAITP